MINFKNIGVYVLCLLLCQAAGGIGAIVTIPNIPVWYASLSKPFFQPPNWLFGPVWTLLYTLMSVALYTIVRSDHPYRNRAIAVFLIQLVLNSVWSFLFFKYHLLLISLIEIIAILISIVTFVIVAYPINRLATYYFIPYIVWVSFATVLNAAIWYLN